jgi:ribonuclease HI
MKQHIMVRAVIILDNKVLLSRVEGEVDYYELPGWILSVGANPEETLTQGLARDIGAGFNGKYSIIDVVTHGDDGSGGDQHVVLVYQISLDQDHLTVPDKESLSWVKLQNLHQYKLTKNTRLIFGRHENNVIADQKEVNNIISDVDVTTKSKEVIVYSDGGSRGNPGPSASGFVLFDKNGKLLFEGGKYLGITTNNQAEYQAVLLGLEKALELGARFVDFRMDSLLIVNQMAGIYKVKNRDLWPIYERIKELAKEFEHVKFSHVRREFNKDADALVNKVLDEHK